jgi:hypothetical protein
VTRKKTGHQCRNRSLFERLEIGFICKFFWSISLLLVMDPDLYSQFGSRMRIQESQINADPDPQQCFLAYLWCGIRVRQLISFFHK